MRNAPVIQGSPEIGDLPFSIGNVHHFGDGKARPFIVFGVRNTSSKRIDHPDFCLRFFAVIDFLDDRGRREVKKAQTPRGNSSAPSWRAFP